MSRESLPRIELATNSPLDWTPAIAEATRNLLHSLQHRDNLRPPDQATRWRIGHYAAPERHLLRLDRKIIAIRLLQLPLAARGQVKRQLSQSIRGPGKTTGRIKQNVRLLPETGC